MARSLNKVILIGNLGQEPDVRYSSNGIAWCSISLATNERRKDNQTGEFQDYTEWHRVSLLGRHAEIAKEYLHKGSKVYIEGRLETTKYTDKRDNIERSQTRIIANDIIMLDSKSANTLSSSGGDDYSSGGNPPRSSSGSRPQPAQFNRDSGHDYEPEIPARSTSTIIRPQPMPDSSYPSGDDDVPF